MRFLESQIHTYRARETREKEAPDSQVGRMTVGMKESDSTSKNLGYLRMDSCMGRQELVPLSLNSENVIVCLNEESMLCTCKKSVCKGNKIYFTWQYKCAALST